MAHGAIGPGSLVASRFRLEDLLEEHSGAQFWRAVDLTLARNVAIHVLPVDDPRAPALLTAARTSATVSDGHLLRVLDAGEEDGAVHVIHEWGYGASLDQLLAEEPLEPHRAAWIVREVADAISAAHRQGVAHGRLVPENVLVTDAGSVKLIGFVVDAVLRGRQQTQEWGGSGGESAPLSEHEDDVRNLGALLYATLTGRWPGASESSIPDAPYDHGRLCRPRQVRSGVPKQLDYLCDRLLNPDHPSRSRGWAEPAGRDPHPETAADVVVALGEYLGDTVPTAPVTVTGPTAFLDPGALRAPRTLGTLGSYDGAPPDRHPDRHQPEDTQPGLPRFDRDGSGASAPPGGPPGSTGEVGWGFSGTSHHDDSGSWAAVEDERPGSSWLRLAALIAVVLVVLLAVLVGFHLGRSDSPEDAPEAASPPADGPRTGQVVAPAGVQDFDPDDPNHEEKADLVPLAVDGDPSTAWETNTYFDGPALAPYRSGVGLLVDLGSEQEVGQVDVHLVGGPYDLQLLAAPEGAGVPADVSALTPLDTRRGASGKVQLSGDEKAVTRYVVVWLTALPPVDGGYRGGVTDLVVRS